MGYGLGKEYDSNHGDLESVPLDSISAEIFVGDDVLIELESSEIVQGPVTRIDKYQLSVRCVDKESASQSVTTKDIPYNSIQTISLVQMHSGGRALGLGLGLMVDSLLAISAYFLFVLLTVPGT